MKSMAQPADERETRERLLDTAERLFGELGYDGVGMRALAGEAKVNLGAATYHFGSKEALYIETFMRRFRPTNAERLRLLREAEAEAHGKPLRVEKIVDCMVRPPYLLGLKHSPDASAGRAAFPALWLTGTATCGGWIHQSSGYRGESRRGSGGRRGVERGRSRGSGSPHLRS